MVFTAAWILAVVAFASQVRILVDAVGILVGIALLWIGAVALRRRVTIAAEQTRFLQWWDDTPVVQRMPMLTWPRPFETSLEIRSRFPVLFGVVAVLLGVVFVVESLAKTL